MLTDPPTKCYILTNVFAIGAEIIAINITNINNSKKRRKAGAGHLKIDSVVQRGHLMIFNNIIIISITDNTNNNNTITIVIAVVQNTVLRRLVIDCHILIGKLMPSRQKRRFPHASDLCLCQGINRWTFEFFKFNNVSYGVKIKMHATQEHQLWFFKILASSLLYKHQVSSLPGSSCCMTLCEYYDFLWL